jgi:hypothetical protein
MSDHAEITQSYNTRWDHNYAALQQYVAREGSARMSSGHREDFYGRTVSLGTWCSTQRQRRRDGFLPRGRAELLEQLPGWEWGPLRPGPVEQTERNEEVRRLRSEGMTLAVIGERFGITRQRVHQIAAAAERRAQKAAEGE